MSSLSVTSSVYILKDLFEPQTDKVNAYSVQTDVVNLKERTIIIIHKRSICLGILILSGMVGE